MAARARSFSIPFGPAPSVPTGSGPVARAILAPAIVLAGGFSAAAAWRLAPLLGTEAALPLLAGLAVGLLAADLVTGLVHWSCDTWGSERTPWVGDALIRSFREHHRRPRAMLENDWIERNGSAGLAGALAWGAWSLSAGAWPPESAPGLHGAFFALATVAVFGNQLHYWAHLRRPPAPVRWLQRAGLFLSPRRHARHHRAPHTGGYCIATGWANPLLDALGFWRALERAVTAVTGTPPRARGAKRENEYA